MALSSWTCKGCTNICHMIAPDGRLGTYCRTIYDQPNNKGLEWQGDYLACLDYTTDPEAEDKQIRMWVPPICEQITWVRKGRRKVRFEEKY